MNRLVFALFASLWLATFLAPPLSRRCSAQEKPLVQSLIKKLQSDVVDDRRDAAHALARYGPEAVAAVDSLADALDDRDSQVWNEATQALAHLGSAAEPALDALLSQLDSQDEQRRYRTAHALGRIGVVALPRLRERMEDDSANVREVAVRAIGWMRSDAADAVPLLIKRLDDDESVVRQCAIDSLGKIGSAATNGLIATLQTGSADAQIGAAAALSLIGHEADEATAHLIQLINADDPNVKAAAIKAIGRVSNQADEAIKPLANALRSEVDVVHQAALESLVRVAAPKQAKVTKELSRILRSDDNDPKTAERISLILGSYGRHASDAVADLIATSNRYPELAEIPIAIGRVGETEIQPTFDALRDNNISIRQVTRIVQGMPSAVKSKLAGANDDPSPMVREVATLTLAKLVPLPPNAIEQLNVALQDDGPNVRRAAAEAAQQIGGKAKPCLPTLIESFGNEDTSEAKVAIIHAINALHDDAPELIAFLAESVDDEDKLVRIASLSSLGDQEKLPPSLHPQFSAAMGDSDSSIRRLATRAIVLIRKHKKNSAKLVVKALKDDDKQVREQALRSVAALGSAAAEAVDVIAEQLNDDSADVRIAAVDSLAQLGKTARPSFDDVAKLATDAEKDVRMAVIKNVRKIEKDADKLLPLLVKAVEDTEKEVRSLAAHELGEMEEDAAPAVPALITMLRKDDDSDAARQALREINTAGDEAVPLFLEILQDEDAGRRTRYYAVYLLRKMGSRAKSALPKLRELAKNTDGKYREYYERAIREIQEDD